jgi:hypothetical protein
MAAATMQYQQYQEAAGLVSGDTAALGRLCGITDTTALGMPFTIKIS